ncbi:MAG: hypothetical protein OXT67_06450 [Zetaproteobacteria bacterium]|nr:hypothetical protein [Zetaproteobacteria bacterium]
MISMLEDSMIPAVLPLCLCFILVSCGGGWPEYTPPENHSISVLTKQAELYESLADGCSDGSLCEGNALLERNRNLEKIAMMGTDGSADFDEIDHKYALLAKIAGLDGYQDDVQFGEPGEDAYYRYPREMIYHPKVIAEVVKVFADFGYLHIRATPIKDGRHHMVSFESRVRPWTGYWHPVASKPLSKGRKSVLAKLDRALYAAYGVKSDIQGEELRRFRGYNPYGWEGRCDGLAFASILTAEPVQPLEFGGESFSVEDQKAVRVLAYMDVDYKQYGINYRGDADTDGTYQDLKPEALHQIAWVQLGHRRKAFVVDESAKAEVWNKALFHYGWKAQHDKEASIKGFADAYIVEANPWVIKQRNILSDVATSQKDVLSITLRYRLYVDRSRKNTHGYRVIAGQWLGDSRENHFGNVKVVADDTQPNSTNSEMNKYIKFVRRGFLFSPGVAN